MWAMTREDFPISEEGMLLIVELKEDYKDNIDEYYQLLNAFTNRAKFPATQAAIEEKMRSLKHVREKIKDGQ